MQQALFLRFARALVRKGTLDLTLPDGKQVRLGDGTAPAVGLHIREKSVFSQFLRNPELAMGEAYMHGLLQIENDDIKSLVRLAIANGDAAHAPLAYRLFERARLAWRLLIARSPRLTSLRNVKAHYDIPTAIYDLFMEPGKQYTCAYFDTGEESLEEAQDMKKHHIARKLCLRPGMRVMDIGCGWGELAVFLASNYGVHVTGVTLSREQLACARRWAEAHGVADRVEFRLIDYRDVDERFDRIVSVGMLEHVGQPQYRTYFNKVWQNLSDEGVALIHFIGRSTPPGTTSPFFLKHIFPGGYTPALSEVLEAVERSGLVAADIEVWRGHYERTLQHWQRRWAANEDRALALQGERFVRMWRYYLAAAEIGFADRYNVLFQVQLEKTKGTIPWRREYLYVHAQGTERQSRQVHARREPA